MRFFLSSLYNASSQFPFTHLSIGASSDKSPRKFNLHLDHTWVAVERQKVDTRCRNTAIVHAPSFFNSIFFLSPFFLLSPSPSQKQSISPLVNAASTLKGFEQFHKSHPTFQKFLLFLKFQEEKIFFFLLMKSWQRDFRRKLFSLPLRAFKFLWCLMLWPPLMWM